MSNNQEKLYIDVDEEITTVVDRLRHTPTKQIAVVVPQRALLLQSIVNLKLLARESKKLKKNLILMTKDEEGIVFASRAGIKVQPFIGNEESMMQQDLQSENYFSAAPYQDVQQDSDNFFQEEEVVIQNVGQRQVARKEREQHSMDVKVKKKRHVVSDSLRSGQQNFEEPQDNFQKDNFQNPQEFTDNSSNNNFQESYQREEFQQQSPQISSNEPIDFYEQDQQGVIENSFYSNQQDYSQNSNQEQSSFYDEPAQLPRAQEQKNIYQNAIDRNRDLSESSGSGISYSSRRKPRAVKSDSNEKKWYSRNKKDKKEKSSLKSKRQKKNRSDKNANSSSGFFSKWIIIGSLLIIGLIGFAIILPKTTLVVKIKEVDINENVNLTAKLDQSEVDMERMIIPARQIKKEIIYTKSFEATGKADVDAQKAQGMVTISNEYNDSDYKLIKTTRFLSEDGVLFRLAENTVIPGMKDVDGKKEAGKVQALLVADQAGEIGNIESKTFRIATFKETDKNKYEKIYAKTESKMQGGGPGGKDMPVVTEADINGAKEIMEKSLQAFVKDGINDLVREEEVLSLEAIEYKASSSNSKVAKDTAVKEFDYEITVQVTALVFAQEDVDKLVNKIVMDKNKNVNIDSEKIEIRYNSVKPESDLGNLKMVVKATAKFKPEFDAEKFRDDIVGKNYDEIANLIKEDYKQIDGNIQPEVFPSFTFMSSKISQIKGMTKVLVE
ncbi:MAG: hypothetical protein KAT32_03885 [Candidatus Moranbacteria bacterium]|nr:hypothetical protein [Candidatus Moranbacteria bacterium]